MKFIDQDIDAQRQNYVRARDSLATKRSAYAQLREQGLSDAEASMSVRKGMLEATQSKLDAMTESKYQPTIVKQRAEQQKQMLGVDAAKTNAGLQQSAAATTHERMENQQLSQNMQIQRMQIQAMQGQNGGMSPAMAKQTITVGGHPITLGSEKDKEEISKMITSGHTMRGAIEDNLKSQKDMGFFEKIFGTGSNVSKGIAARDAFSVDANPALGSMQVPSELQMKGYKSSLEHPWNGDAAKAASVTYMRGARDALKSRIHAAAPYADPAAIEELVNREYPPLEGEQLTTGAQGAAASAMASKYGGK